jgi:ubiquinone/menaquinone biosynthesis C-methylase UbiE
MSNHTKLVKEYFRTGESRMGYKLLLNGIRHCGFYPLDESISHKQAQINMMDQVAVALRLPKESKVLDAGCGEGATAIYLAKKYGFLITGIDLLEESIEIASNNVAESNTSTNFLVGDFNKLPYPDNTFDGIYAIETIVHGSNPKATLKEFKRVLKPKGHLVIADYTWEKVSNLPKRYRPVMNWINNDVAAPGALIIWPNWYEKSLAEYEFKNVQVKNITANVMPMIIWFWRMAIIPYQIIRLLKLQSKFVNTTMGYYSKIFATKGWWQYIVVRATK